MTDFVAFDKIPRLNREIVITEKIDGTNAQVFIQAYDPDLEFAEQHVNSLASVYLPGGGVRYVIKAGSRNRWLSLDSDNFGFARWVYEHAAQLVDILGEGRHFGEWWGSGIQRTYGLDHKRFSLFNTSRWGWLNDATARVARDVPHALGVVPELYRGSRTIVSNLGLGMADDEVWDAADHQLWMLREFGSMAAPGFEDPEGIIVYHTASNQLYKATCQDDEKPKRKKQ